MYNEKKRLRQSDFQIFIVILYKQKKIGQSIQSACSTINNNSISIYLYKLIMFSVLLVNMRNEIKE